MSKIVKLLALVAVALVASPAFAAPDHFTSHSSSHSTGVGIGVGQGGAGGSSSSTATGGSSNSNATGGNATGGTGLGGAGGSANASNGSQIMISGDPSGGANAQSSQQTYSDETFFAYPNQFGGTSIIAKLKPTDRTPPDESKIFTDTAKETRAQVDAIKADEALRQAQQEELQGNTYVPQPVTIVDHDGIEHTEYR